MKPQHAGSNYSFLLPFIRKAERTGRNVFKAGLGHSRLLLSDRGETFGDYGNVFRIGYADSPNKYYEVAVNDEKKTAIPLRYVDPDAVSLDNSVAPLREINCFWFSWKNPCPKPEAMRKVDTMLWKWIDYLTHREYYNAKYA